jgi:4-amino-4-deoxy-L-arabinose transferase-like glycosyltransferase
MLCCALIFVIAFLASAVAVHLAYLVDTERLIPVSDTSMVQALLLAVLLYFTGLVFVSYLSAIHNRISLFTLVFLLRVVTGFVVSFLFQYDDERAFHYAGVEQRYGLFSWEAGAGYYHLMNILYAAFGPNLLLPKVVNALLGSLLPFFVYDLAQRFFAGSKAAWRTFLFAAFLPPLVFYSAVNLKEIATAFLLVLTLWCLVVIRRSVLLKITGVVLSVGTLYLLRDIPWAAVPAAGVVTYLLFGETWRFRQFARAGWLSKLVLVTVLALVVSPFIIEPISETIQIRLIRDSYFTERFIDSSATVNRFVDVSNSLSPKNLAIFFLRGLYSPSPLRSLFDYGLDTVIESFIMVVWYALFPFAIAGFLAERHKGAVVACGVSLFGVLAMTSMGLTIGSDPYRHRIALMGLLFILAGGGYQNDMFRSYRSVFYLWWLGALLFTGIWVVFRI